MTRPLMAMCTVGSALVIGSATGVARAGDACTYDGAKYSDGALSCQAGKRYKCDDGEWKSKDEHCTSAKADTHGERVIKKKTETETEENEND